MAKAFTMWYLLLSSPLCAILIGYLIDRFEVLGPNFLVIAPLVVYKHAVELIHPISQRHEIAWRPPSNFNQRPGRVGGPTPPPNVILIVADDLGFNDLSHGCGVATPNIDSIRDSGVHFTHAYAGQATCAPSRAALLTGRYSTRFGYEFTPVPPALARVLTHPSPAGVQQQPVFHKEVLRSLPRMQDMVLPANETLVSQLLQERGYDTYVVGKWDSGGHSPYTPRDRGFNESLGFTLGASLYHRNWHPDIVSLHGNPFDDFLRAVLPFSVSHNNGPPMDPDQYMTDYLADEAANLVASRSQQQQQSKGEEGEDFSPAPYFLMLTFNAPHNPYQALRSDMQDAEVQALPTQTQRVYAAMVKALD
ncbi:alkaline-phosphatase-like protein, partial [Ochromonadaceae sp. CCMP2298]